MVYFNQGQQDLKSKKLAKAVKIPRLVQLERRTASRAAVTVDGVPELGFTSKMKVDMELIKN
ncbi:MAG: hypothetical protein EHM12_02945 [Dehalococcoidia bacterium]|nr:MAG: hypothetical protein EHM12_02945 [Dehalococcoidia bacterium]